MSGIEIFMDLFSGRKDCYGLNQFCLKEDLTEEVYKQHLDGFKRIGVYPIIDKKFTKWIACDIDTNDFNKTLAIKEKANHFGLECYIEKSKSKGHHVFCFFDKPIEAVKPRLIFEMILEELEIKCELFPKQDEVKEDQFGNFIFIPLFGGNVRDGRTVFINDNQEIIISKDSQLTRIKTNKIEVINSIIETNNLERKKVFIEETEDEIKSFSKTLPCIEKIKEGIQRGHRHECAFRLIIYFKERGLSIEEVRSLIKNWNSRNEPASDKNEDQTWYELEGIIKDVYKGNFKSYGCENGIISNYCDKEKCPIIHSQHRKEQIEQGIITMVFRDPEVMIFRKKNYEYRLAGFEFTKAGKFKVSLTLSRDGKILFKDLVKLDMANHRKRFIQAADDNELDIDLIKIDDLVKKQIEKEEHERLLTPKQLYIMTEQEKNEAIKYLEAHPDILYKVTEITNRMGVVGDEILRLMVYLCFTSRILKDPLSIIVKGEASSGKSFACQNVQKLIPEEGYYFITRATQNAFYHLSEDGMQHRIIYINELQGSESADYSIRTAQSEGDLILMMPMKDPVTGNIETITKRVKGPVGFLVTTTKASMFDENETRNFSVFSDDSPQLTTKIGDITIRKALGEEFRIEDKELNLWRNMQRILNPDFKVIIPYAKEVFMSFPDKPVRIRRDRERFRVLIEIITILHQFHREQKKTANGTLLISTLADYYAAKSISETILTYTIYEIGPSAEELWNSVSDMAKSYNIKEDEEGGFTFKHKDISRHIGWKVPKIKKWMYTLIKCGLVDYSDKSSGGKGRPAIFKISNIGLDFSAKALNFLPQVEDLYAKYPCDKDIFYNPLTGKKLNPMTAEAPEGLLDD